MPAGGDTGDDPRPELDGGPRCDGCLSAGEPPDRRDREIKACAANRPNAACCSGCEELPCRRIMNLIDTGPLRRDEYLPNLAKIREVGVR
jgi:hypothetical protein